MNENPLEKHILATYLSLRYGLAAIAFSFPVLLWIGGHLYAHVGLQNSMSAYYYACTEGRSIRTWFCGTLFAVAACLYLYKGYRRAENIALNLAGLLALGIAEFPMDWTVKFADTKDAFAVNKPYTWLLSGLRFEEALPPQGFINSKSPVNAL